ISLADSGWRGVSADSEDTSLQSNLGHYRGGTVFPDYRKSEKHCFAQSTVDCAFMDSGTSCVDCSFYEGRERTLGKQDRIRRDCARTLLLDIPGLRSLESSCSGK